jgi:hypothetical protein
MESDPIDSTLLILDLGKTTVNFLAIVLRGMMGFIVLGYESYPPKGDY